MELTMTSLAVSSTSPPTMISSRIPYTLWKLKTMSSSQTFPKYWSRFSTKRWMSWVDGGLLLGGGVNYHWYRCRWQSRGLGIFCRRSWSCGTREGMGYLDEVSLFGVTPYNHTVDLGLQALLLVLVVVYEPFRKTGAATAILKKDEADLNEKYCTIYGGFEL